MQMKTGPTVDCRSLLQEPFTSDAPHAANSEGPMETDAYRILIVDDDPLSDTMCRPGAQPGRL